MEKKYYVFKDILDFLGFKYKFEHKDEYPFNRDPKNITFSWGQILIPKYGIREMVQNKVSDNNAKPINEIVMMYQILFMIQNKDKLDRCGMLNQDISLSFRYDKEYKYGTINKSIYEVCFYVLEHAIETNDFFIITDDYLFDFFSAYIIDNQWGLGALITTTACTENYFVPINTFSEYCINCNHLDNGGKCTLDRECIDGKDNTFV